MRTKSVILCLCLLSLCWLGGEVSGQGDSTEGSQQTDEVVSDNENELKRLTPLEKGMQPFYKMTNVFLGIVQNRDIETDSVIYKQIQDLIPSDLCSENSSSSSSGGDGSSSDSVEEFIMENWQSYALYGIGYVVCVVIGLLFIIIMPIVGLCFCCCRLCGNCGGKGKAREGRHHRCRQFTCGTLLFVFNTIMLVGLVFAFMTNEQLRIRTSPEPNQGVIPRLGGWLDSFNGYTDTLVKDIRTVLYNDVDDKLTGVINRVNGLPDVAISRLDGLTNTSAILAQAKTLATAITKMKELLGYVDNNKTELVTMTNDLKSELDTIKTQVLNILNGCTDSACDSLRTEINNLDLNVDFTQQDQDISEQIDKLNLVGNITQIVKDREADYKSITDDVRTRIQSQTGDLTTEKDNALKEVMKIVESIERQITNMTQPLTGDVRKALLEGQDEIELYGSYWWYSGIGLSCVFLLIILCYYLGLMFGVCGEPPYEDATACNKGVGANLLLAGVGFCFLFGWLLMLVCLLLFIPGAVVHGEVCRHLTPNLADAPYLKAEDYLSIDSNFSAMLIDEISYPCLKSENLTVNISDVLRNCRDDQAIYKALALESLVPLDQLDTYDSTIRTKVEDLKTKADDIDLSNINIIDSNTRLQLEYIRDSTVDNINFNAFFTELSKVLTTTDLDTIISQMESVQTTLPSPQNTQLAQQITKLRNVQTTIVRDIENKKADLRTSLDALRNLIDGTKTTPTLSQTTTNLITAMDSAQTKIDTQGKDTLVALFVTTADEIAADIPQFITGTKNKLRNDVGKCGRLYGTVSGFINVGCVDFLYPFNGFWFSFGWVLAFFIPSIIAAVHLAGSYRKTEEYDPTDTKSFDDPNFDAYSGGMFPGDNIPLEDYNRRKAQPGGRGGLPNSAYVTDQGHPSGRAPPAAMPYRDNYSRDNYSRNGGPPAYPASNAGGYGGRGGGGYGGATPPNPPHYYNNRPGPY